MADLSFLKDFRKKVEKMEDVSMDFSPPSHWYHTGNYALNKILSGHYKKGVPQSRVTILAGPSGAGKSFLLGNIMKNAQDDGCTILAMDSENALDFDYLKRIGVDISENKFIPIAVTKISDVVEVCAEFIKAYVKDYGRYNPAAPRVLIALDSLDMLITDTENEHFDKGVQKGDQGQRAKQMKHFLRTMVSRTKATNISFVGTHQVYANSDLLNGEGLWIVNGAVRYSASQIALITKLKLKEDSEVVGIRMRVEAFKSRFAKLGSKIEIEVPFNKGLDKFGGLCDMLEKDGVLVKEGYSWVCEIPGKERVKFREANLDDEIFEKIMQHPKIKQDQDLFEGVQSTPEENETEAETE